MSFVNAQAGNSNRVKAALMVGGVHALIAAGLVAGLAVATTVIEEENLPTIFIEADSAPPTPEVETQPEDFPTYVPPKAQTPEIALINKPTITVEPLGAEIPETTVRIIPTEEFIVTPRRIDPPLAPQFTPAGPQPRNGPSGWISNNDYPSTPLRRGEEGTANYRLVVGSDGRVDACEIISSTSSSTLDRATCRLLERRARFDAATDAKGAEVVGTYSGTVTWQIPD